MIVPKTPGYLFGADRRVLCRFGSIISACLVLLLLSAFSPAASGGERVVDLELVLAVDVSASVSPAEFDLQRHGLAEAFRDPTVQAAIAGGNGIAVALVYWAGDLEQRMVVAWSLVSDAATATEFADRIETTERGFAGKTAIGEAMAFAAQSTAANAYSGDRVVIDISGDGWTNTGRTSRHIRDRVVASGITINGLAILDEVQTLVTHYRDNVVGGPGSFVASASDSSDFVRAIRLKLIREISWRRAT